MSQDPISVTYRIHGPRDRLEQRVESLLLEQTVELPRPAVRDPFVVDQVLPRVSRLEPGDQQSRVTLEFASALAADCPAQLINLLYGNSCLQEDLCLEEITLPASLKQLFGGPRFGIAGLRSLVPRPTGALACTALKPMGLSPTELAARCFTFAKAGLDLIKEDHGLADHRFCPFEERMDACMDAIDRAADESGRRALYIPHLSGSPGRIRKQLELCRARGVDAVLLSPMLLGLAFFHELVTDLGVPVLAHPALAGLRIAPSALLGTLLRVLGADAVIFPHHGGRFAYSRRTCRALADELRAPDPHLRSALPMPAGGMDASGTGDLLAFYGEEVGLLIGGSLYLAGDELADRAREFAQRVHAG